MKNVKKPSVSQKKFYLTIFLAVILTAMIIAPIIFVFASLSFTTTIEGGSMSVGSSYIIFRDGATYYSKNGTTGAIDFSSSNATTLIQATIDSLSNGGKILVKTGTYVLSGLGSNGSIGNRSGFELENNIAVFGEGIGNTIFLQDDNATINRMITTKGRLAKENITLSDFTINGNYLEQNYTGINDDYYLGAGIVNYGDYWNIDNIYVHDVGQYGGLVTHGAHHHISDFTVENTYFQEGASESQRQWTTGVMVTESTSHHNTFSGITCINIAGDGFMLEDNTHSNTVTNLIIRHVNMSGLHFVTCENNTVVNLVVQNVSEYGVSFSTSAPYQTLIGVDIQECTKAGIYVLSEGITVNGGILRENTAEGVLIYHGNFSSISNLKITANGGRGIWFRLGSFNNTIVSNVVWDNSNYGIDEDSPGDFNIILGNVVYSNTNGQIVTTGGSTIKEHNQE